MPVDLFWFRISFRFTIRCRAVQWLAAETGPPPQFRSSLQHNLQRGLLPPARLPSSSCPAGLLRPGRYLSAGRTRPDEPVSQRERRAGRGIASSGGWPSSVSSAAIVGARGLRSSSTTFDHISAACSALVLRSSGISIVVSMILSLQTSLYSFD